MTNTLSLWLGGLLIAALAYDFAVQDWQTSIFLGRRLLELTEYIAFWR